MATKTIKTRLQLIGGNALEWTGKVLYKNEVGVEWGYRVIREEGQPDRVENTDELIGIKIGDGVKKWEELEYFGGNDAHVFEIEATTGADHVQAINEYIEEINPNIELVAGAVAIVKEAIPSSIEKIYTAYVFSHYEETEGPEDTIKVPIWKAMDGNVNANNVYFSENVTVTTDVGNITTSNNAPKELLFAGKNLKQVYEYLYAKEDVQIAVTGTSATISLSKYSDSLEVGSTYTLPTASVSTGSGQYTEYGGKDASGTKISKNSTLTDVQFDLSLKYTKPNGSEVEIASAKNATSIDTTSVPADKQPNDLTVVAGSLTHTFSGSFKNTASAYKPITNLGNFVSAINSSSATTSPNYADGALGVPARTTAKAMDNKTYTVSGFRKWYYGGDTNTDFSVSTIKKLTASSRAVSGQTFELQAANYTGCSRIVIAIPAASNIKVKQVFLKSSSNSDITSEFKQINTTNNVINIGGVDNYDPVAHNVWEYKPASLDSTEVYTIIIG